MTRLGSTGEGPADDDGLVNKPARFDDLQVNSTFADLVGRVREPLPAVIEEDEPGEPLGQNIVYGRVLVEPARTPAAPAEIAVTTLAALVASVEAALARSDATVERPKQAKTKNSQPPVEVGGLVVATPGQVDCSF